MSLPGAAKEGSSDRFSLSAEPGGLSAKALGKALGVSDQTVDNYRREGMPVQVESPRGRRYDLAACTAWVQANKPGWKAPGVGRGGKREGAGRPTQDVKSGPVGGGGDPDDEGLGDEELSLLTDARKQQEILRRLDAGEGLFSIIRECDITPRMAKTVNELVQTAARQVELSRTMGKLLEAEDVEAAWSEVLVDVDGVLREVPTAAARDAAVRLGLNATQQETLRTILQTAIERARSILAARDRRGHRPTTPTPTPTPASTPTA